MPHATAASFSNRWWCLVIGVDDAGDPTLPVLGSAERDAKELVNALSDSEGCAIPRNQVVGLVGPDATRQSVLSSLERLTEVAGQEDSLLVFFAGHGLTTDGQFLLCTTGVDVSNGRNGVTGADLDTLLGTLAIRGVLVVLDCCQSAGLAENAPETFRSLRQGEYRILLSSARAGQSSWELSAGEGTLFSRVLIDIIAGRISTGGPEGAIYFADLIRALDDQVAELRETKALNAPQQQLIYTGAFSKDPLLFVHRSLSLQRLQLRTARYSPAYVHRILLRVAVTLSATLFFFLTSYYAWLENTEYATSIGKNIAIYQGHPEYNAFGFPKHLWTLDYKPEWLKLDANGQVLLPLVSSLGKSVIPALDSQIRPELRAGLLAAANQRNEARRLVLAVLDNPSSSVEARLFVHILLADIATEADVSRLRTMLSAVRMEPKLAAAVALSRLAPESIFPLLMADLPTASGWDHSDILENLKPSCTQPVEEYLNALMGIEPSSPDVAYILSTALRIGCEISVPALVTAALRPNDGEDIAGYARFTNVEVNLGEALKSIIRGTASSQHSEWRRGQAIDVYARLRVASCFEELFDALGSRPRLTGITAALAIGKLCGSHKLQLSVDVRSDTITVALIAGTRLSWSLDFKINDAVNLALLFAVVDEAVEVKNTDYTRFLNRIAELAQDDEIRKRSLRALSFREKSTPLDISHLDSNVLDMRRLTFESRRLANESTIAGALVTRVGHQDMFYVELLGRAPWPPGLVKKLLGMLNGSQDQQRDAACALAMQAPIEIVTQVATHKDVLVRENVASCLAYHVHAQEILIKLESWSTGRYPLGTLSDSLQAIALKTALQSQLEALSSYKDRLWRISLLGDHPSTLPTRGLRYWAREQRFLLRKMLNRELAQAP